MSKEHNESRLQEIKDEIAKEKSIEEYNFLSTDLINEFWNEVCKRYAFECCKASLGNASLSAKIINEDGERMLSVVGYDIDIFSITSEQNIVIL